MRTLDEVRRFLRKYFPDMRISGDDGELTVSLGLYERYPGGPLASVKEDDIVLDDEPERPAFGRYRRE